MRKQFPKRAKVMKNVLVTGANGHLGNNLVRLLKEKGYRVRASVRGLNDPEKTHMLESLDVELVEADLMKPGTLSGAVAGMDGLFQVAAVYRTCADHPQREIIAPSVSGGMNILRAAQRAGVRKVVFTSSIAALGSDAPPGHPLTEADWNDDAQSPYFRAKTRAERNAWAFARESGLNLVVINPGAIIGPGFYRHTPSTWPLELLLRGKLPFALPFGTTFVDVRDVARAHLLAYEQPQAAGRYLAADRFLTIRELVQQVKALEPELNAPERVLPKALLKPLVLLDWFANKLTNAPRQVTLAMVRDLGGQQQRASPEKIRRELGWRPMEFQQSLRDTLAWIREKFLQETERKGARS